MKGDKSQVVRVVLNGADERVDCQVECKKRQEKKRKRLTSDAKKSRSLNSFIP